MFQTSFWNNLKKLEDELKSNQTAFEVLHKLKEDQVNSKENSIYSLKPLGKDSVLHAIEELVRNFLEDLSNERLPKFVFNKRGSNDNIRYTKERGLEMVDQMCSHEISLGNEKSLRKYAAIMNCLSVCYSLLQSGKHATKRDIYYSNVNFFQNQHTVDEAISDISCMLGVPRNCLNVLSSSKGFIGGDLSFKDEEGNTINCAVNEGVQVPSHIDVLHQFQSKAKYILVVEKEAIYQRLMEAKISEKLGPCILTTGRNTFRKVLQ